MRNFALFNSVLADELVSLRLAHATAPEPQPAASHPRGRRRAAAAPPIAVTFAAAVTLAAYIRVPAACHPLKLHKAAAFVFHSKVSALHKRRISLQLSRNLGPKNINYAMKFGHPPGATLA